jgi:hypothetical protein
MKTDWPKLWVWVGLLVFSLACWALLVIAVLALVKS